MKKELHLGALFYGRIDPSFDRILNTIKSKLGDLEVVTKKVTEAQKRQGSGILELGKGLKSYIKDVEKLLIIQARWYGAKALLFAAVEAPVTMLREGLKLAGELDKARAMMNRYDAMENQMTATTKALTEEIITQARQLATQLPISFEEIIKSADRLRAAGVSVAIIRDTLKDFAQLQVAFPEIEAEKFTTAVIGFLNAYRNMPGLREMATDGDRLRAILDKLVMGLAKGVIAAGDLNRVIQHMGQASQSAGFSLDMMVATAVMLTNLGSKAPAAARAFRGLLNSLTRPETVGELKRIGIELDRNLTLAEQFPKIVEGLRKAVGTGGAGFKLGELSFLGELTSTERMGALTAIIKEWDKLNELQKEIAESGGALGRAADVMMGHLTNLWIVFKNINKEMGKLFFDEKMLANILEGVNKIFRSVIGLPKLIKEFADELRGLFAAIITFYTLKTLPFLIAQFTSLMWVIKNLGFVIKYFAFTTLPSLLGPLGLISAAVGVFVMHLSALRDKAKGAALDVNTFRASLLGLNEEALKAKAQFLELQLLEGVSTITGKKEKSLLNLGNIREQLKIVREMIKEVQKTKIEPPSEEKPGEGVPEKIKAFARSRIASAKAEANTLLAIWEGYKSVYMAWLEGFHKLDLMSDEDYYKERIETINETASVKLDALEDAWKEERKLFALERQEHAGDAEKLIEINAREKAERLRLLVKFHEVYNAKEKAENDIIFERAAKRQDRLIKLYEYAYNKIVRIVEFAAEKIRFAIEEGAKESEFAYERGLISTREFYNNKYKAIADSTKNEKDVLDRNMAAYVENYAEQWLLAEENLEKKEDLDRALEAEEDRYQKALLGIEQKASSERTAVRREEVLNADIIFGKDGYLGVMKNVIEELNKEFGEFGSRIKGFMQTVAQEMTSAFSDFFFDAMSGKLKTLEDYWRSFASNVMQMISQMLAKWIMFQIISGITGALAPAGGASLSAGIPSGADWAKSVGAGWMHKGGFISDYLPRYHDGLAPDERLAVLQTKERVLSRDQNKMFENLQDKIMTLDRTPPVIVNMNISAIDAASFDQNIMQRKSIIAAAVMAAGKENHPVRRSR